MTMSGQKLRQVLQEFAGRGDLKGVKTCLQMFISESDDKGTSALSLALSRGHENVLKYFVEIEPSIVDVARSWAERNDQRSNVDQLLKSCTTAIVSSDEVRESTINKATPTLPSRKRNLQNLEQEISDTQTCYVTLNVPHLHASDFPVLEDEKEKNEKKEDSESDRIEHETLQESSESDPFNDDDSDVVIFTTSVAQSSKRKRPTVADPANATRAFPLHTAAMDNDLATLTRLLRESPARVDESNDERFTALMVACAEDHIDCVRVLLEARANVSLANAKGDTPLSCACCVGGTEVVQLLLDRNVNVNTADDEGDTPLMNAAENGHVDCVQLLCYNNVDVNATNKGGGTALMWAAYERHDQVVDILIKHGADVSLTDENDGTALKYAVEKNYFPVVKLLEDAGAFHNARSKTFRSDLYVIAKGNEEMKKYISNACRRHANKKI